MQTPDLDDLARRPARYWHIDGLPELILGSLWAIVGGASLLGQRVPHDWRWTAYWLVVPLALAVSPLVTIWATRRLKERLTLPRAGYAVFMKPAHLLNRLVGAAVVAAASLLALLVLTNRVQSLEATMPASMSVLLSLVFLVVVSRRGRRTSWYSPPSRWRWDSWPGCSRQGGIQ